MLEEREASESLSEGPGSASASRDCMRFGFTLQIDRIDSDDHGGSACDLFSLSIARVLSPSECPNSLFIFVHVCFVV